MNTAFAAATSSAKTLHSSKAAATLPAPTQTAMASSGSLLVTAVPALAVASLSLSFCPSGTKEGINQDANGTWRFWLCAACPAEAIGSARLGAEVQRIVPGSIDG